MRIAHPSVTGGIGGHRPPIGSGGAIPPAGGLGASGPLTGAWGKCPRSQKSGSFWPMVSAICIVVPVLELVVLGV